MKPRFFRTPADFRHWLERNHGTARELVVGYYKKDTGRASITWPESVDQALCFGWIDGVRRSLDPASYTVRFTPRRPRSAWSAVNLRRARALIRAGLMTPAGLAAWKARGRERGSRHAQRGDLPPAYRRTFRARPAAWAFWQTQPPGYRRLAALWVTSAVHEETRRRRLAALIADSAAGRRVPPLRRPARREARPGGE